MKQIAGKENGNAWGNGERTLCWEGEPVLVCTLTAPALPEGGRGMGRITRWCRRLERTWITRWERALYPRACAALRTARAASRPFRPWTASLEGGVTLETEERLSLIYDAAEQLDGPHRVFLRTGMTWELPSGCPLPLSALFPPGFPWRGRALEEAEKQLRARQEAGEARFWPDWERALRRSFDPERFYLTPEGAVLCFPLYALGPYMEGAPEVLLSVPAQAEGAERAEV